MKSEIIAHLPEDFPWRNSICYFDSIDSTNSYAKRIAAEGAGNGTIVVADSQTAGRGRMGRSFHSPQQSGIYLSIILRPKCAGQDLMHLTCAVGVAMCNAMEQCCSIRPGIKWINDLVLGSKKIGGILTELSLNANGQVDYAVVGIGINCNQPQESFPEQLQQIATSIFAVTGNSVSLPKLTAAMIVQLKAMADNLFHTQQATMLQYEKDCVTLQKEVVIHTSQGTKSGFAYGIDNSGGLLVRYDDGNTDIISSGEASVRGMYGYL